MSREPAVPEIDRSIHEPARLRRLAFLSVLARADRVCLLRESGISKGNLSVQMTKLSDPGFVEVEKSSVTHRPRTTYSLTAEGRQSLRGPQAHARRASLRASLSSQWVEEAPLPNSACRLAGIG